MLSAAGGLTVSADPADVAGGHKLCSGDTETEGGCQSIEETRHILTPFHMLPVTEGFISQCVGCNGKAR